MLHARHCIAIALTACSAAPFAETYDLKALIDAVTVYRSEAMVGRQGDFKAAPGEHVVLVRGLPSNFDPNTLQVRLAGPTGLVMGGVELRETPQDELANPDEAALQKRLSAARDELSDLQAERESAEASIRFIQSLIDGKLTRTPEGTAGKLDPEVWKRGWESVGQGTLQQRQKVLAAQRKEREQAQRIATLERQLEALRTDRRDTRSAVVAFRATQAGAVRVNLSYLVPDAGWLPVYEARLDTATRAVVLGERAIVTQRTGEDWKAVRLVLSTSAPRASSKVPELGEWRLSFAAPVVRREAKMRMAPAAAPAAPAKMMAESVSSELQDAAPAAEETAEAGGSAFVTEYRVPGQVTVTADGAARKVSLREATLEAKLSARIVPAIDPRAYLVAGVRPAATDPLLPGSWMMFRDGALVGEHRRPLVRPGEEIALSFGVDDRIEVKRTTRTDTRGERGFTGNKSTVERDWKTTVKNRHKASVAVELHDRVPVAAADDIEVEPLKSDTPPTVRDLEGKRGVFAWRFELAPDASQDVNFGYRVTWPKDRVVPGL